jgi:hypothetical protein
MDPRGGGPPLDASPDPSDADSDRARIAQATGMLMELFGLGVRQALALLHVLSWMKLLSTSSTARELVERWPVTA